MDDNILSRDAAIEAFTTPTGRVLGIELDRTIGKYFVRYVDEKGGSLPEELRGQFTAPKYAESLVKRYLNQFWDTSDKASKKRAA